MDQHSAIIKKAAALASESPYDIVAVYAMNETCVWASSSHLEILGYSPEEMIGHHWKDMVAPEDHDHASLAGSDALLNGQSIQFGLRAVTKSGSRVSMRGKAWISVDSKGQVPYLTFHAHPNA